MCFHLVLITACNLECNIIFIKENDIKQKNISSGDPTNGDPESTLDSQMSCRNLTPHFKDSAELNSQGLVRWENTIDTLVEYITSINKNKDRHSFIKFIALTNLLGSDLKACVI